MAFKFFKIPLGDDAAESALNGFLGNHKILVVDRRWVDRETACYWSFCVEYLEGGTVAKPLDRSGGSRARVDYKEVFKPEDFAIYIRLRDLRQEIAKAEAVPVYTIFTNDQLAQMVETKATTRAALGKVEGVSKGRLDKYAERILQILSNAWKSGHEAKD